MVEGNLVEMVVFCLMLMVMLIAYRLTGQLMLKVVDISHYFVLQSEI